MLALRFTRAGRRNSAFFRIVLTDHSKSSKSGFIKVLGWYDPKTKKSSLEREAVLDWIKLGAKPSNSLAKFLNDQKISHKNIVFVADAPKKPKVKEEKAEKPKQPSPAPTEDQSEEATPAETPIQEEVEATETQEAKTPISESANKEETK